MEGFRVVICGGGIAAVEGLLRLRRLLGDRVGITLLSPSEELRYRPLAVNEPFAGRGVRRYPLKRIAARTGADWIEDGLEWLDADGQLAHTTRGEQLPYDALLLAIGTRSVSPIEHATLFDDAHADDAYLGLVRDVEDGYTKRVALVVPEGVAWPLPAYELALMTAERAYGMGFDDAAITLVTPEPSPLAVFGDAASDAVAERLRSARVSIFTGAGAQAPAGRRLRIEPAGEELEVDRIVALPRLEGPRVRDLPTVEGGFVPIDDRCRVVGLGERVFAAGDATSFPVKQGGIGAQQADLAAAGIARLVGTADDPGPLRPMLRGALYTGGEPIYMQARLDDGTPVESQVLAEPPWPSDDKVVAEELGPFLRLLDQTA